MGERVWASIFRLARVLMYYVPFFLPATASAGPTCCTNGNCNEVRSAVPYALSVYLYQRLVHTHTRALDRHQQASFHSRFLRETTMVIITISNAGTDDLPFMADINRSAYFRETIAQFAFRDWPECKDDMLDFFKARLTERFAHTDTQIFKATDSLSGAILGFVCLSTEGPKEMLEDSAGEGAVPYGPKANLSPTARIMQQIPPYFNQEFVIKTGAEVEGMKKALMEGQKHHCKHLQACVVWALLVEPVHLKLLLTTS